MMIFNKKLCIENIKLVKILTLSIFLIKYVTSTSLSKDTQISRDVILIIKNVIEKLRIFQKIIFL